ncbi:MAG: NfeD family protein [Halodesulfurarchaeum sp.]
MVSLFGQSVSALLFIAGVGLCILEAFAPGAHFIVIGVALLVAGLAGLLFPPIADPLFLGFLVFISGGASLYVYRRFDFYRGTDRARTRSSADLAGERGYVVERVTPRAGRVKLQSGGFDPTYAARSIQGDIPEGVDVIVVDPGGGNVLTVEAVSGMDEIDRELAAGTNQANPAGDDFEDRLEGEQPDGIREREREQGRERSEEPDG